MASRRLIGCTAFALACNFFAFQIEPFEAEYELSHPAVPDGPAISSNTLSWESFGKEDAPQPFIPDPGISLVCLLVLLPADAPAFLSTTPTHPVRDKSPPRPAAFLTSFHIH